MPFFSAIADLDLVRKTDALDHQGDPAWWRVVPVTTGVVLHFALLNEHTCPMGRIICALTGSPYFHCETWLDGDTAPLHVIHAAEDMLGQCYDYEGALRAWDNSGFHTAGKWWCSEVGAALVGMILPCLFAYPNPGKLFTDVSAALGNPQPMLAAPRIEIGDADYAHLESLAPAKIATGTAQEIMAVLQAMGQSA